MTRLGIVAAVVAASFFGGSAMAGEVGVCTDWNLVDTPSSGKGNHLKSVDALDASNVWAVGQTWNRVGPRDTAAGAPVAVRWDGSAWTAEPLPDLTHMGMQPTLEAVGIAPTGDPWVVGGIRDVSSRRSSPLILRWSRGFWEAHRVALANSFAPRYPSLRDVAAIAENDAWVVGEAETLIKGALEPFAAHWDGTAWSEVAVPGTVLGNRVLTAVAAAGPYTVWAVGYDLTGATEPNGTYARIYRWDGRTWSVVKHPAANKLGSALQDIVALAPNDVWAVGGVGTQGLFLHWDGSTWTSHQGPANADPRSVDGSASNDVWAAGAIDNYHWDGATWNALPSASEAIPQRRAIAVAGPCDAWTISSWTGAAGSVSVVQRLVASAPALEPPPTPSAFVANPKSGKVIVLAWLPGGAPGAFSPAENFVIERCAGACEKPFAVIQKVSGKLYTFADSGLESGTSYLYRISAVNAAGSSEPTAPVTARTPDADLMSDVPVPDESPAVREQRTIPIPAPPLPRYPPATPVDFVARPKSVNVIVLDWLAGGAPGTARQAEYFVIERCAGDAGVCDEPFAVVQKVSGKLHSIADSGLKPSTSYTYRIFAGNAAGLSDPSNPASAKTLSGAPSPLPAPLPAPVPVVTRIDTAEKPAPPAAPTALSAKAKGKVIVLAWLPGGEPTAPVGQTGFVIERCVGRSGACLIRYAIVGKVGGTTLSFVDSGLTPKAYTYRVYAVNAAGSSQPTAPVTAIIRPSGSPSPAPQGQAVLGSRS